MRPFKRDLTPFNVSYSGFYNALVDKTGEYCHFCEKTLRNMGSLFHRSEGVLAEDYPLAYTHWTDLFLICDDCAYAVQHDLVIKKNDDSRGNTEDHMQDVPEEQAPETDIDKTAIISVDERKWVLPSGVSACLWPDDEALAAYRDAPLLRISNGGDTWRMVNAEGMLMMEEIKATVALEPVASLGKELAGKLWNTIHLFKLNGFYLSTHPTDTAKRVYYIPAGQQFNDLRIVMRIKVLQLARKYLDQINALAKFGYQGAQIITDQFRMLQELYGYWSVWAATLQPPSTNGEPAPAPVVLTNSLLSIVPPENLKKRKADEDEEKPEPKPEPEQGDTPDDEDEPTRKRPKRKDTRERDDKRNKRDGDDMKDE